MTEHPAAGETRRNLPTRRPRRIAARRRPRRRHPDPVPHQLPRRQLGGTFQNRPTNQFIGSYDDHGFRVVFDVDQPTPFTFHHGGDGFDIAAISLAADGSPPVGPFPAVPFPVDVTGVLAPGHYTFTGDTNARAMYGANFDGTTSLHDLRLTVGVPEPTTLPLLAAPLVLLLRRAAKPTR
jgi:hypothetical protein